MKTPINPNAFRRRTAYVNAMQRLGYEPDLVQVDGTGWNFEEIGSIGGKKAIAEKRFTSGTVLCSNDRLALGLLSAAFESGLRVGHSEGCDLRVAGHDDHPFARFSCPSLTTVSQDYEAISVRCAETILRLINTGEQSGDREIRLFEGRLIMRGSA
jgi:DNA-binding LacI/PurR family transcriptional regulator